jgi:PAS domain-containing protein
VEILELIGQGLANKEIAARSGISLHTVETHRKHIAAKLGVSGAELVKPCHDPEPVDQAGFRGRIGVPYFDERCIFEPPEPGWRGPGRDPRRPADWSRLRHAGEASRLVFINETFTRLFGYTLADIPTVADWARLAYPDEAYRREVFRIWDAAVEKAVQTHGSVASMEFVVSCKNGDRKSVLYQRPCVGRPPAGEFCGYYRTI